MSIRRRLYRYMRERAERQRVKTLSIGLGYTAVEVSDGGMGLAYTSFSEKRTCSVLGRDQEYEDGPALNLLALIRSEHALHRSMALALINALNHSSAAMLAEDRSNDILFDLLAIGSGARVAMAGWFGPLAAKIEARGAELEVADIGRGIGEPGSFAEKLDGWADALILTSTSILNDTADEMLAAVAPRVRVAMVGPSTPMIAEAFYGLPVHVLAGSVPIDREGAFRAVRNGKGTPVLHRFAKKVYMRVGTSD